ncbi:hypothetical protein ABZ413_16880 [Nocardia rhamnosiphila]
MIVPVPNGEVLAQLLSFYTADGEAQPNPITRPPAPDLGAPLGGGFGVAE